MNTIDGNVSELFDEHAVDYTQAGSVTWIEEAADLPSGEAARSIRDALRRTPDALPGALFTWRDLTTGEYWHQYRPETVPEPRYKKDGKKAWTFPKYFSSKGSPGILPAPTRAHLIGKSARLLIPEGTLKVLSAASYAPEDMAVVGIAGIQNWVKGGLPSRALHKIMQGVREIWVAPDADVSTNVHVWDACTNLAEAIHAISPGATVRWVRIPATKGARKSDKSGLDDYLATLEDDERADALDALLSGASTDLPPRPVPASDRDEQYRVDREAGITTAVGYDVDTETGEVTTREVKLSDFAIVPTRLFTATAGDSTTHTVEADFVTVLDDGRRVEVRVPRFPLTWLTDREGLPRLLNAVPGGYGARLIPPNRTSGGMPLHRHIQQAIIEALPDHATQTLDRTGYQRLADGRWAYATPGRVVTKDGATDQLEVRLRDCGGRRLTVADVGDYSQAEMSTVFSRTWAFLTDAASRHEIAVAALGVVGLAAGGYTRAPRASVTFVGPAALGKSWWSQLISAMTQGGPDVPLEDAIEPTATMTGTSRALQEAGAGLHEAVAVYDDVRPSERDGTSPDFEAAKTIMRVGYNGATAHRSRLTKDEVNGGFSEAYRPQAVPVAVISAESLPVNADTVSALSRTLTIPTGTGLIAWPRTGLGARDAERELRNFYKTRPWLVWATLVRDTLWERDTDQRERPTGDDARTIYETMISARAGRPIGRSGEVAGALLLGFDRFARVGAELGAWSESEAEAMRNEAASALARAAVAHFETYVEPGLSGGRLLDRLREAVASGRARLGPIPYDSKASSAPIIGETRGGEVRLLPGEAARVLGVTAAALRQALEPVAIRKADGSLTHTKRIDGTVARVIVIPEVAWNSVADDDEVQVEREAA